MSIYPHDAFDLVREGSAGRSHVAQVMKKRGYVKSLREAFDKYLAAGKPANVSRRRLTPIEAISMIRKVGGVPVLAHPGLADLDSKIPGMVEAGLQGIE